jgi:DNA-binding response OmpR family regulator
MTSTLGAPPTTSPAPAMVRARVLVIDDEPGILNFVSRGLRAEGYTVDLAADGDAGLSAALDQPFDLVILDLLLPGTSGIDLLRQLVLRNPGQPVIVLSALTDTVSKVQSFELGAEDYLAKPFSIEELLARVRARLRDARSRPTRLVVAGLTLDLIGRHVHGEFGRALLAEREFLLLRELMSCAGETVSKDRILAAVWGYRFDPGSNVVDVYVRRLRAKIGGELIKTVRGEGYRIDTA